jgi:hypothetical protein
MTTCSPSVAWKKDFRRVARSSETGLLRKWIVMKTWLPCLLFISVFLLVWVHPVSYHAAAADQPVSVEEDDPLADFEDDFEDDDTDTDTDAELGDDFGDTVAGEMQDPAGGAAAPASPEEAAPPGMLDNLSIDGYVEVGATWNVAHDAPAPGETDWRGLSKLKTELQLEAEYKFSDSWKAFVSANGFYDFAYTINGRDNYTSEVLRKYEQELELRKAYVQGSLTRSLDIKAGRQIVVWGRSDNIRITDVLNPLDVREPGLTDIEEIRLPVAMTKLDYYYGDWNLSGIAVHEHRYNKTPVYGSDFYPYYPNPLPTEHVPSADIENTELAVALNGVFSGWDISFYYADFYDDNPYLATPPPYPELYHARLSMVGTAFNITSGNWLFKGEGAYFNGIKYSGYVRGFRFVNNPGTYSRLDYLGGIEYTGFDDTTIAVEVADRLVTDYDYLAELSGARERLFQSTARILSNFYNDTLHLTLLAAVYGPKAEDGAFYRLTAVYDVTDNLELTGGGVLYQSGDLKEFSDVDDNDRIFCNIRYHF